MVYFTTKISTIVIGYCYHLVWSKVLDRKLIILDYITLKFVAFCFESGPTFFEWVENFVTYEAESIRSNVWNSNASNSLKDRYEWAILGSAQYYTFY